MLDDRDVAEGLPESLPEDACLALLGSRDVGRIAFELDGRVEVFPVNYGLEGRVVVFRTNAGTKLAAAKARAVVFEVDAWEENGIAWSVVLRGRAAEVTTDPGRAAEHLRWVPIHPAAPGARFHWIAVKPDVITGRRFRVVPAERSRP